jgi:hypothetical protein
LKSAIDAVVGGGLHSRRWAVLNATVHPIVRARLRHPTPILRRVALDGINQYGWDLGGLFTVAPELRSLSLSGEDSDLLSPSSRLDLCNPRQFAVGGVQHFRMRIAILEKFVKTQRLTTLELTGTWSIAPRTAPVTLPTVRTLILNARGPISVMFSAIILPALVQLTVIGGKKEVEKQNVIDDRSAFKSVASKLETLRLESLHFDNKDHLKNTLVAAPKVKSLTMKDITYRGTRGAEKPIEGDFNRWRSGPD